MKMLFGPDSPLKGKAPEGMAAAFLFPPRWQAKRSSCLVWPQGVLLPPAGPSSCRIWAVGPSVHSISTALRLLLQLPVVFNPLFNILPSSPDLESSWSDGGDRHGIGYRTIGQVRGTEGAFRKHLWINWGMSQDCLWKATHSDYSFINSCRIYLSSRTQHSYISPHLVSPVKSMPRRQCFIKGGIAFPMHAGEAHARWPPAG